MIIVHQTVDRGRIPSGGAIMNGSFLAGAPRCAE